LKGHKTKQKQGTEISMLSQYKHTHKQYIYLCVHRYLHFFFSFFSSREHRCFSCLFHQQFILFPFCFDKRFQSFFMHMPVLSCISHESMAVLFQLRLFQLFLHAQQLRLLMMIMMRQRPMCIIIYIYTLL
jgi:hypothetical protein